MRQRISGAWILFFVVGVRCYCRSTAPTPRPSPSAAPACHVYRTDRFGWLWCHPNSLLLVLCHGSDDEGASKALPGLCVGSLPFPRERSQRRSVLRTCVGLVATCGLPVATSPSPQEAIAFEDRRSTTTAHPFPSSLREVTDPDTYSASLYTPPSFTTAGADAPSTRTERLPLIVVLHGAGRNDGDIRAELVDPRGEHAGLIPSLIASGRAPAELLDNFAVLAPYAQHRTSFYDEPRDKLLRFVNWALSPAGQGAGCPSNLDPARLFLWGFSDGATVAVELLTTGRFAGGVVCSYGFTGVLPDLAVQRLSGVPLWVFHSADDQIFPIACSDRLVQRLQEGARSDEVSGAGADIVRYSRFESDPENFPPDSGVRGHTMGITASKDPAVYRWLLSL